MAAPAEVQAAIIMVSGDWARYLETIKPEDEGKVLERLLGRYKAIFEELKTRQGHF